MASTFFGLTIAASGLNTFQVAVNTTANNISNVKTEGYSRQQAIRQAAEALRVNQKYGTAGSGVETTAIRQIRDIYYDVKYWNNNSKVGLYETKLYYSLQIEDYLLDDDTMEGFTTLLDDMFNALDTVQRNAASGDARKQFISSAQSFASYFNSLSTGFSKIQDSCNQEISTQVATINSAAQKIASLNKQINVIELQGGYANELRDQRNLLIDQLSAIVPVEVNETEVTNSNYPDMHVGATNYTVKINGQTLVSTFEYNTLECVAREYKVNQSDIDGLYDVVWSKTNTPLVTTSNATSGSLRALFEMRDGNNKDNFKATVSSVINNSIGAEVKLTGASIKDVNDMTMNEEGYITINNKKYKYNGFSYDAGTGTYTFQLDKTLTAEERSSLQGKSAEIGTSVDAMGIPYYMAQLNSFLRAFCQEFNSLQKTGVDGNGDDGTSLFVALDATDNLEWGFEDYDPNGRMTTRTGNNDSYYRLTAANISVAAAMGRDATLLSVVTKDAYNQDDVDKYDLVEAMMKLKSDKKLFRGGGADEFLQCLISDNSVDTQKSEMFYKNYTNLSDTIQNKRMSISGVDEDEEALDLLKFQNAYNLASRMIQTMSEMYDRLILQTGV